MGVERQVSIPRSSLSASELAARKPVKGEGGRSVRAFCPFHGGDRQRSLRVDSETGRFHCFACGAWGYLDGQTARQPHIQIPKQRPVFEDRSALLAEYQRQLPWAREYLENVRGIPMDLAKRYGLGFAHPGRWANRDVAGGRVVVPHTTPDGAVVNLYGRAASLTVAKEFRHDHLPGPKGYFNGAALAAAGEGPLYVCEGPFDALSLIAAGRERAVAIFGVRGWRWEWARGIREVVLALDADAAGSTGWKELAREGRMRGVRVSVIESYGGGAKDVNESWLAGQLNI